MSSIPRRIAGRPRRSPAEARAGRARAAEFAAHAAPLVAVGALMAAQAHLRVRGLQRSDDPAVASVLYAEIAFCSALDVALLDARPAPNRPPIELAGTALIAVGAFARGRQDWRAALRSGRSSGGRGPRRRRGPSG